jgi:membrane protein
VALMLLAPILFVIASSVSVFVVHLLDSGAQRLPVAQWLIHSIVFFVNLIPYCLFWALFTFLYLFMPNTRVHFRSACLGGLFTGCLYLVVQLAYIYFQVGASRYGAIYGSMAALPLFLIWLQASWFLFLFGAEISYAHQTLAEHEFEARAVAASHSFKRLLSLWIVHLSLKGFLSREMLVQRYQIPYALAEPILRELVSCQILHESKGGYVPDQKARDLKISDVVDALDHAGTKEFPFIDSQKLAPFEKALDQFRSQIESSPHNIRLSHVPHSL